MINAPYPFRSWNRHENLELPRRAFPKRYWKSPIVRGNLRGIGYKYPEANHAHRFKTRDHGNRHFQCFSPVPPRSKQPGWSRTDFISVRESRTRRSWFVSTQVERLT